jgi:hypothetical protein
LLGQATAYAGTSYEGSHNPVAYSTDLKSFVVFNAANRWAASDGGWTQWSGTRWSTGSYVGAVAIALALAGALDRRARVFLCIALVGTILALGPYLHIGGTVYADYLLPGGWLFQLVPALSFGGIVSRFTWLTTFGLSLAACGALAVLDKRGRWGRVVCTTLVASCLVETLPARFATTKLERAEIFATLRQAEGEFAILDASGSGLALWHQTQHRRPLIGGYVTRTPTAVSSATLSDPILSAFQPPAVVHRIEQDPSQKPGRLRQRLVKTYRFVPDVEPAVALAALRRAGVRYVVVSAGDEGVPLRWQLRSTARTRTVAVFEVPATDPS